MRLITDEQLNAILDQAAKPVLDYASGHPTMPETINLIRRVILENSAKIEALPVEDRSLIVIRGAFPEAQAHALRTQLFNTSRARTVVLVLPDPDADVQTVLSDECQRMGLGPLFQQG